MFIAASTRCPKLRLLGIGRARKLKDLPVACDFLQNLQMARVACTCWVSAFANLSGRWEILELQEMKLGEVRIM